LLGCAKGLKHHYELTGGAISIVNLCLSSIVFLFWICSFGMFSPCFAKYGGCRSEKKPTCFTFDSCCKSTKTSKTDENEKPDEEKKPITASTDSDKEKDDEEEEAGDSEQDNSRKNS